MLLLEHSFKASHSCARINIKKKTFPQISVRFNRQENTAKMPFKKVTHVIFDVDGLLLGKYIFLKFFSPHPIPESESAYDKIVVEMIKPYGKIYTNEVKIKTLGVPEPDTAAILIKELQLPLSASEFLEIYQSKVKHFLQNPPLMPGIPNSDPQKNYKKLFRRKTARRAPPQPQSSSSRRHFFSPASNGNQNEKSSRPV